jgi:hypothetical protein
VSDREKPLPHPVQVDIVTMIAGDHGHAGEPALGSFCRYDEGKPGAAAEVEGGNCHVLRLTA